MITWVTVWVLTVTRTDFMNTAPTTYQLTYATQKLCLEQADKLIRYRSVTCNFQQVPVYIPPQK